MTARYAYTVRYRRRGWQYRQARYYRHRDAAVRHIDKLRSGGRFDLSPIVELTLERQALGPVETLWALDPTTPTTTPRRRTP